MADKTVTLGELFDEQQILMDRMGWPGGKGEEGCKSHILAAKMELSEAMSEINWKPWKASKKKVVHLALQTELTDVLQFVVNAALCMGYSADDLSQALRAKLDVNHQRIDKGDTVRG